MVKTALFGFSTFGGITFAAAARNFLSLGCNTASSSSHMITTAIFAEILITGLQATVWLTFACFLFGGVEWISAETLKELKDWASLITFFVLGFAYALGIIVDRLADSLFHPFDNKLRDKYVPSNLPFVAVMRLRVMSNNQGMAAFLAYIRSRVRLARSTAFNLLLTIPAATTWLTTRESSKSWVLISTVIVGGLLLFVLAVFVWVRISGTYYKRLVQAYSVVIENQSSKKPLELGP